MQNYHFAMIGDTARNRAYRHAIEQVVLELHGRLGRFPRVLDLGSGTGFLGMLAARMGADVWCVEMNPVLCGVAAECVFRNAGRLQGRVSLLPPMLSTQIRIGHDLPQRVDLVISEILDADLISEGALASLRHAKQELLTEGGVLLPYAATVFYVPMECTPIKKANDSFDLSPMDEQFGLSCQPFRYDTMPHRFLAQPLVGFEFDFYNLPYPKPGAPMMVTSPQLRSRMDRVKITATGTLWGLGYWFDVYLAKVGEQVMCLPAGPGSQQRTWKQNIRYSLHPRPVHPGDVVDIACAHDDSAMFFILREDIGGQVFAKLVE